MSRYVVYWAITVSIVALIGFLIHRSDHQRANCAVAPSALIVFAGGTCSRTNGKGEIGDTTNKPRFVLTHLLDPHPPFYRGGGDCQVRDVAFNVGAPWEPDEDYVGAVA